MRLKSALRRGVAAAVIAGIVVSLCENMEHRRRRHYGQRCER